MDATTVKARPYVRVSQDSSGRERSPEEQLDDLVSDAATNQWQLVDPPYRDVGSASRYQTKARKGFAALVTDLAADRFGADVLMIWEPRRGSRKVSEWLALIEACADRAVTIWVHTHHRMYDPRNGRDRRTLLEDAVDGEYDATQRSEAVTRAMSANASAGAPHGIAPYGYTRTYTVRGRSKTIRQLADPVESKVIAELFERVERGHPLSAIARDFGARGIRTRSGRPWTPQHLRSVLRTAAYAGWRVHRGERHDADWPALVDRRRWLAVQRMLNDRRGDRADKPKPGTAKHLLSMIAVCAVCGGPLRVEVRTAQYTCRDHGHVLVDKTELDALVWDAVVAYLSDETHYAALMDVDDGAELECVEQQLAEARAEQDALAQLSARLAAKMEPPLLAKIAELERRQDELRTPSQLASLLPPGKDIGSRLAAAPLSAQRAVMRLVLLPGRLGEVRVDRSPEWPRRVPAEQRVVWRSEVG